MQDQIIKHHQKIAEASATGKKLESIPHWEHEIDELERNLEKNKRLLYPK